MGGLRRDGQRPLDDAGGGIRRGATVGHLRRARKRAPAATDHRSHDLSVGRQTPIDGQQLRSRPVPGLKGPQYGAMSSQKPALSAVSCGQLGCSGFVGCGFVVWWEVFGRCWSAGEVALEVGDT